MNNDFFNNFHDKQLVIYGLGISGIAILEFFAWQKYYHPKDLAKMQIIATDDNFPNCNKVKEDFINKSFLPLKMIEFLEPNKINYNSRTIISFSPGIPLYFPKQHFILDIIAKTKARLTLDLEIFQEINYQDNFIAITGTNGKSTTTALTGFIFDKLKINSYIGGNIGKSCFSYKNNQFINSDITRNLEKTTYIFETSSYQLDLSSNHHYQIAALTNITPDHLDRHNSFAGYIDAKKRIFYNQKNDDYALINIDNQASMEVFKELQGKANQQVIAISTSRNNNQANIYGIKIIDNIIFDTIDNISQNNNFRDIKQYKCLSPFLFGEHNYQNIAFAYAITRCYCKKHGLNINPQEIINIICQFKGLDHRLQIVRSINHLQHKINFINDSKATNAESSENALKSFENILWIVGGRKKEGGINILQPYFGKVLKAYLIGESANEFADLMAKYGLDYQICHHLENAIKQAVEDVRNKFFKLPYSNIILSPACASFDQWQNFEKRGEFFTNTVTNLKSEI
jgi:UDP-N-acetylmuramoylalanine--D-glutamate ligase